MLPKNIPASKPQRPSAAGDPRQQRVAIERVAPEVDGGRFPAKRVVGEHVVVEADIFADGQDAVAAVLRWRHVGEPRWTETPFGKPDNDRWRAAFTVSRLGRYRYTIEAWVDRFATWRRDFQKRVDAGQDIETDARAGVELVGETAPRAHGKDREALEACVAAQESAAPAALAAILLGDELSAIMAKYPDRSRSTAYARELEVIVDPERARFSTWYEMFPRSSWDGSGKHATFRDCTARLPHIAGMGFDVLYLPPIHPIGRTHRKGRNNSAVCKRDDPGSPWAIGAREGGHDAVHPELGTLADFRRLVAEAGKLGIDVALDIAYQCSPDHPYVTEHPDWFRWRPDGTIQYAENPPKKYEDIYPLNFDSAQWSALWQELKRVIEFWIEQGIRIFRVDNPHTKPFQFWEWMLGELKNAYPDTIFLAEAFTRPKVMYRLAKAGFTQSYTYFAWRNHSWDLQAYLTELTTTEVKEYFRPNFWPNTPDILNEYLQTGGRPAFIARLVLAATMTASYGVYGPAFELCEDTPREPGSEEYLHSEKYEIRRWNVNAPESIASIITRVNRIRRDHTVLQANENVEFHAVDNDQLICYSKCSDDRSQAILVVVNLDPKYKQSGWVTVAVDRLGIPPGEPYEVHDLLTDKRYVWNGPQNYVELNPVILPAHIFRVRRRIRSKKGIDTFE